MSMVNKSRLILAALTLIMGTKVRESMDEKSWIKVLLYAFDKGYLYFGFSGSRISRIAIGYRCDNFEEARKDHLPDEEKGSKMFFPIYINTMPNEYTYYEMIDQVFNMYKEVNEVGFETRAGELKIFNREGADGQGKKEDNSVSADVPV